MIDHWFPTLKEGSDDDDHNFVMITHKQIRLILLKLIKELFCSCYILCVVIGCVDVLFQIKLIDLLHFTELLE